MITRGGSLYLPAKFANLAAPRCIMLQQWYASGEYKVTRATFCIYNAFKRVDVRCEASFPGHVRTYYVDGSGKVTENVPEDIWGQAFLCSLIRALQPPHPLLCIKILPPPPLHLDNTFLELAKRFFWEGKTLSTSEVGSNCAPPNCSNSSLPITFVHWRIFRVVEFQTPLAHYKPILVPPKSLALASLLGPE